MVAIPLGLRAKLYIKPWASIAIAFFTLGFTFDALIGQKDLENFKRTAFVNHNVYTNSYNALIEGCKASLADTPADCQFFIENIKAADMSQPEQILSLIDQVTKYDVISKKKIKNFAEVFINKLVDKASASDSKFLQDYKIGLSQAKQDIEQYHEDHFLLTRNNMNWKSFTLAQWTHNNWRPGRS